MATYAFKGRQVAWLAQRAPDAGQADVYVDGVLAARVDLSHSSVQPRRVVFVAGWSDDAAHEIEIRAVGDGSVTVDALLVMSQASNEVLVGAGDISRCTNDGDTQTAAVVAGIDGVVFTTGDNVYLNGTTEEFAECYDPTWGAFKERTRPVPGNHDYGTPDAAGYFDYFGANAGDIGSGWYAYNAGTWRVYALNSECTWVGGCAPGSPQYEWLARQLAAEPHRCTVAVWHRPVFSSGPHGSSTRMAAIYDLLDRAGAEVVLTGHDHLYERLAPAHADGTRAADGVRQFVVGTGGSALYAFSDSIHPLSEVRDNSTHGVLRLDLHPGRYAWQFLPAGDGTFTDTGSAVCH